MNVITLVGNQDSGKTTTLKNFISELYYNYPVHVVDVSALSGYYSFFTQSDIDDMTFIKCLNKYKDAIIVLEYINRKIGITTLGDKVNRVAKIAGDMKNICDIFICASHPNHDLGAALTNQNVTFSNIEKVYAVKCDCDVSIPKLDRCRAEVNRQSINEIMQLLKSYL